MPRIPREELSRWYCYEVYPVNFVNLPPDKQDALIDSFKMFLNAIERELKITVVREKKTLSVGSASFTLDFYRFFVESRTPVDSMLKAMGLSFESVPSVPKVVIVREKPKMLVLEEGKLAKAFTVYKMPPTLVEGFLAETYGIVDRITVWISPLSQETVSSKLGKLKVSLEGMRLADMQKGRTPKMDLEMKIAYVNELLQRVLSGGERMFDVKVSLMVSGSDVKELNDKARDLRSVLGGRLIRVDSPAFMQSLMLEGEGKKFSVNTETLSTFFPFTSADIVESGGVFLGVNMITGTPIVFDISLRSNLNASVIGVTGSGKSFTTKIFLNRLFEKAREPCFFIVDPENEYIRPAREWWNAKVFEFKEGEPLGLDPFKILPPSDVADFIMEVTELPKEHASRFRTAVSKTSDMRSLYSSLPSEVKNYLSSLVEGPESYIFEGEPFEFSRRMVFALRGIENETVKRIISLLVFGKVWQMVNNPNLIPLYEQKIFLIDEAWLYFSSPTSARFIERVSRLGRKRNIVFITNTQRPSDVLEAGGAGKTVIENSATKILLRQDPISIDIVAKVFNLSEQEREFVTSVNPGEGLLITGNVHVPIKVVPTEEEYAMFSTKPSEVTV